MSGKSFSSVVKTIKTLRGSYVCPSCSYRRVLSTWRALRAGGWPQHNSTKFNPVRQSIQQPVQRRLVSAPSPVTVVNPPRLTPPAFRKLDQALANFEKNAAVYVNTSQLRLALRGLESTDSITRIAILELDGQHGAARLARALLADPLAPDPDWEKYLKGRENGAGKAILLRYGEQFKVDSGHPLVETLFIPSSLLDAHKIEILIQKANIVNGSIESDSLLVPSLATPGAYGGRMSMVTYPVHKVLLYVNGLENLPIFGDTQNMGSMLQRVVNGTWSGLHADRGQTPSIIPVNLSLGENAIKIFRQSLENSIKFEHAWFDSGMSSVATWLSQGTNGSSEALKPSLRRLIEFHLSSTLQSVQAEEDADLKEARATEVSTAVKDVMEECISTWAENAHTELRDRLNNAFLSKSWRKTKWWKLLWRVDEVGFIALNILNRAWLVDAEREMIWLSGRIRQSGLLGPPNLKPAKRKPDKGNDAEIDEEQEEGFGQVRGTRVTDVLDEVKPVEPDEEEPLTIHPWPQNISFARSSLSRITVPPLHALSQTLMLQTVSTTFLTSTLSALVYVGVSSTSIYEAGTVATLGLVVSLRRLQTKWETAREQWKTAIREDGGEVLRREEQLLRDTVRRGGEIQFDLAASERRRVAREAVTEVQDALDEIPEGDT